MFLTTPVAEIPGIGTVTARNLKKLDIHSVGDLLLYFPFRYDDFSQSKRIADLEPGETVNITATIELIQNKRSPRRRMYLTEALVNDGSDSLRVIWFNQPFLTRNLKSGDELSLSGRITEDYSGLVMSSPQYEKVKDVAIHTQGIVPMYHLSGALTQKGLRSAIAKVIALSDRLSDWLPEATVDRFDLMSFGQAVRQIHFPENEEALRKAKERLGFNELFLMQLRAQAQRRGFAKLAASPVTFHEADTKDFVAGLDFDLTNDQKKAAWEIIQNMDSEKPMLRLLQGDVGSGKTIVASLAMLNVSRNALQSALMAPTEILAFQHFKTMSALFKKQGIRVALLSNSYQLLSSKGEESSISKKDLLRKIAQAEVDIIIGTHALIQKGVEFGDLALVVVDEQHRFGVEQRKSLTEKVQTGRAPHLLSMTATPIPRSLALAIYGDLDISVIREMPVGRKIIETKVVSEKERSEVYALIEKEFIAGRQAFIICPLIDESDTLGVKSVKAEFERLDKTIFKEYKLGILHGRLKASEREKVMSDFSENKINALVATSIVEIGLDIPNATVMMVEDADRFGLAQLHQYRGRVGRRNQQAYCFLMTGNAEPLANRRLEAMTRLSSGFDLARADLEFRGPGEVYGLAQKGFPELKMANFYDTELIKIAREAALEILAQDTTLAHFPAITQELGDWEERAHLE